MERHAPRLTIAAAVFAVLAAVLMPFTPELFGFDVDLVLATLSFGCIACAFFREDPELGLAFTCFGLVGGVALFLATVAPVGPGAFAAAILALPPARPKAGTDLSTACFPKASFALWDALRWPNFTAAELACKCPGNGGACAGEYYHHPRFLDALQRFRDLVGKPLRITSGRRCAWRNAKVGGATKSQHKLAIAADIDTDGHDRAALARAAVAAGFTGIGFGVGFLHVDMRAGREGFHYPGGAAAWTRLFGFDPAARFDATGTLDAPARPAPPPAPQTGKR